MVNNVNCVASIDSGAEIGVLSETVADKLDARACGHIKVRGIFSDSRRIPLVNVEVKLCGDANCENVADGRPIVCAVAPFRKITRDMVLPNDVVTDLRCLPVMNVVSEGVLPKECLLMMLLMIIVMTMLL